MSHVTGPTLGGAPPDPRPLVGEPVSLDLLNTVWIDNAGRHDLLDDLGGLAVWLTANALAGCAPTSHAARHALIAARNAIAAHIEDPESPGGISGLNAVLSRGALTRTISSEGPSSGVQVATADDLPAWTAAEDYLQLLARDATRIRHCAHPDCVLHFYDSSPKGNRRWCSMAGCGNRAKAARHYARGRHAEPEQRAVRE